MALTLATGWESVRLKAHTSAVHLKVIGKLRRALSSGPWKCADHDAKGSIPAIGNRYYLFAAAPLTPLLLSCARATHLSILEI